MAEIGLVTFAKVAMSITGQVVPNYRTTKSKHLFTQPQLLSILCLMRYEDWTFREAEVRLREHSELRQALQLKSVPDYTTLYRFVRRLDEELLQRALQAVVKQLDASSKPSKKRGSGGGSSEQGRIIAVDATGLAPGSISTFFVKRAHHRKGSTDGNLPWRYWLKWVVVVDVERRLLLGQIAK